jgi:hypothetical protein
MTTQMENETRKNPSRRSRPWVTGVILICIGVFLLLAQYAKVEQAGRYFLPALGLIFLVWGAATRNVGLLIPGGIVGGIGLGAVLIEGPFAYLGDESKGGVFLLCFALGWGVITLFSALFTAKVHWWPLIPGGIMAVVGGALLASRVAPQWLTILGSIWPIALILVGLWLIIRWRGVRRE